MLISVGFGTHLDTIKHSPDEALRYSMSLSPVAMK